MKRLAAFFVALFVAFVVTGLWAAPDGDAAAGKTLYAKKCATCHGPDGEAKPAIAKMFKVEMQHLGSKEAQALKDADIAKIVKEGKGKMKAVAGLSDADIANLIAHVRTLKQK